MTLEAGTKLGHYEVLSSLGAGGMGEVYRAKDTKLGREVAIKLLLEEVSADPERLARFEREARILASLNHANIASLHAFERDGDTGFLVMELVEGETLADLIARGPIPVDQALPLFLQIAEGLEAAHEKGVIHRDLKPANIKVSDEGNVKILDFGLAKAMAVDTGESDGASLSMSPTLTLAATQRGEILGTAAYMSPEQARGLPIDKRTDVWAFGVCLYEALTGQRTFQGEDASMTMARVLDREPEWNRLPEDVPRRVRDLLRRCLRKDPKQRLRDIGDARIELSEAMGAPEDDAVSATPAAAAPSRSVVPLAIAAAVGGLVIGVAAWLLKPSPDPPPVPVVRSIVSAPPSQPLAVGGPDTDVAITPDGTKVVYRVGAVGELGLFVRTLDQLGGQPLAGLGGNAVMPFLSPDSTWVGYLSLESPRKLKKVSILGGPSITICEATPLGATWGEDGTIVFADQADRSLYRVSAGGGEPELLAAPDEGETNLSYRWPAFLPGNRAVLFTLMRDNDVETAQIAVLELETQEVKILVPGGSDARYLASGHLVYGMTGTLRAVPFDLERLEVTGDPVPVLEGVATEDSGAANFALSTTGSLVYAAGAGGDSANRRLAWVDREGKEEPIAAAARAYLYPRISPSGDRVAVSAVDEEVDIWVWHFDRETLTRLTFDAGRESYPVWTPDGRSILFDSSRVQPRSLFKKSADGTGTVERLTEAAGNQSPYSTSPDGQWLVLREQGGSEDLMLLDLEGDSTPQPLLVSEFVERNGEISPDGRWLAYQSNESGVYEIYVRPFPAIDDGRWQISTTGGAAPLWSPDGTELFYRRASGLMAVTIDTTTSFQAGSPRLLFEGNYYLTTQGRSFDIHPDGQRFLMIVASGNGEEENRSDVVLVQNWAEELKRLVPTD